MKTIFFQKIFLLKIEIEWKYKNLMKFYIKRTFQISVLKNKIENYQNINVI